MLDLRDTAGGNFKEMMAISSMFGAIDNMTLKYRINGNMERQPIWAPEGTPRHWTGKTIMVTNGLCGSACDYLAKNISSRKDVCTYGTPTAGRTNADDEIKITDDISLSVPMVAHFDSNGDDLEGKPFIPEHKGSGGVYQAIDACARQ